MRESTTVRVFVFAILSVSLLLMNGCAFGNRNIALDPISTNRSADLRGSNVYVVVNDNRNPLLMPVVGHVKNGYGMKTADVVADKEVTTWVKASIENELKRYGATLNLATQNNTLDDSKVTVDVLVCYAQAYWRYGGEVKARVSVDKQGVAVIKDREYSGTATLGTNWGATAESYQEVLSLAMKDFLEKLMPDLERVIQDKPKT